MKNKRNSLKEKGITLIALVVTIVVLLILAGVSINALFGNSGIIKRAQDAQSRMNEAQNSDLNALNDIDKWINNQVNGTTGGDDNPSTTPKISTLIDKSVDKNTKAEDAYGNKITIPKGFKVLPNGTEADSATYTYSGNNIPAVQDGIVIEDADKNQFVWVPVGTIKNKDNTTNTITLGRYSDFTMTDGKVAKGQPVQVASVKECTQEVVINNFYNSKELSKFREGNGATDSTAENATARNLAEFIETTIENGGYYIARFEASGTTSEITSKYNQTALQTTQPKAAQLARKMYGEVKENNELVYASDLVNSYAWDTAIIFIQTYSTGEDANTYANQNKGTTLKNTGINADKYCNIWDMSGNEDESTTENVYFSFMGYVGVCSRRGGISITDEGKTPTTSTRECVLTTGDIGFRVILYVK